MFRYCILPILVLTVLLKSDLRSQATLPESPGHPAAPVEATRWFAGFEAGVSGAISSGTFSAPCKCAYESGSMRPAPLAGVFLEHVLTPDWHIAAGLRFGMYAQDYSVESILLRYAPDGAELPLDIIRNAEVRTSYLSIFVDAKWYTGLSEVYLSAGPDIGIFLRGTFRDAETIKTPGYVYPESRTNTHIYADGDFKDVYKSSTLRLGVRLAAGYDIPIFTSWLLSPEIGYLLALTPVAEEYSSWKLSALQAGVRLRVPL